MALMHERKWSTAPHDGWAVEKVIIDYANDQIKQVWKKMKPDKETDGVPTPEEHCLTQPIGDGTPEAPQSEKAKGKALKRPAASMKSRKKAMKAAVPMKTATMVNKVKKAKAAAVKTAKKVNKVKKAKK